MAVVLPAPFGPKNPKISPESTRREKLSSALTVRPENQLRYSLVMPSYSRTAGTLGPFYRSLASASDHKVVTNGLALSPTIFEMLRQWTAHLLRQSTRPCTLMTTRHLVITCLRHRGSLRP